MTTAHLILLLQAVISVVLPLLVALVTTKESNPSLRAVLLAFLATVTSVAAAYATALTSHQPLDWFVTLLGAILSFAVAVASHFGLWSPTGASGSLLAIRLFPHQRGRHEALGAAQATPLTAQAVAEPPSTPAGS